LIGRMVSVKVKEDGWMEDGWVMGRKWGRSQFNAYLLELRESRRALLWWCAVLLWLALDEVMRGEELWDR
jgi:hypothetical protein